VLSAGRMLRASRLGWRGMRRRMRRRMRPAVPFGSRNASRVSRVLRRFAVLWRARRR